MEAVLQKSGGENPRRLRKRMVKAMSSYPESKRFRFAGSSSASAGKYST